MAITYRQAPYFSIGDPILASSHSLMAEAFNDRLRNGVADPTRRIHLYIMNLFRQVKYPIVGDDPLSTVYPSSMEWSAFYQMLDRDEVDHNWPENDASPGTALGANPGNPAMQFIFGTEMLGGNNQGEAETINKNGILSPFTGTTPAELWEVGRLQRGGIIPSTGDIYAPMFELAQSHSRYTFAPYVKHHKGSGGYLPIARDNTSCECMDVEGTIYPNYLIKFTQINHPFSASEFGGTCPPEWSACDASTNVAYVYNGPYYWHVYTYGAGDYYFPKDQYIEGPYDGGGVLSRVDGDQINRLMINPYIVDFRGMAGQRSGNCWNIKDVSFDNDAFLKGQYLLAPAYATMSGEDLIVRYPTASFGPALTVASGSYTPLHSVPAGFVVGGVMVQPVGLIGTASLLQISGSQIIKRLELSQSVDSYCYNFTSESLKHIQFIVETPISFSNASGNVYIESSDLLEYKPRLEDLYAYLRVVSTNGISEDVMDIRGKDFAFGKESYQMYISSSCAYNVWNATETPVPDVVANTNPVLDSSRRFVNSFTRVINGFDMQLTSRKLVVGYELVDGKSVLYIKRHHSAEGLATNNIDMFAGIANPITSSNGIITVANSGSYTNEWLMFMNTKAFKDDAGSIFSPDNYANFFPYINRCHFSVGYPANLQTVNAPIHDFAIESHPGWSTAQRRLWLNPETVSAYNYDGTLNRASDHLGAGTDASKAFYKSCQVYPKDYDIESITIVQEGGEDIARIAFKTRFQHCDTAPDAIPRNPESWDLLALRDEPYRTDENAIRQFIAIEYDAYKPRPKLGDREASAGDGDVAESNVWGAVYPTFFFTKCIPKPYAPNPNSSASLSCSCGNYEGTVIDVDRFQQMETYLKAMCEGYIDSPTSTAYACQTEVDTAYDFTYENLVYWASGGTHNSIPFYNPAYRSDKAKSYGPVPNTVIDSYSLNLLSACVNKLVMARLILPWKMECKTEEYRDREIKTADITNGGCTNSGDSWGIFTNYSGPVSTTLYASGSWETCDSLVADLQNKWVDNTSGNPCQYGYCVGNDYYMESVRTVVHYRFAIADPDAELALNDDLRNMIATVGEAGFFGYYNNVTTQHTAELHSPSPNWDDTAFCSQNGVCSTPHWAISDTEAYKWATSQITESGCDFYTQGVLDPGINPPSGDVTVGTTRCGENYSNCNTDMCNHNGAKHMEIGIKNTKAMIIVVPIV